MLEFFAQPKYVGICCVCKQTYSFLWKQEKQKSMWSLRIVREKKTKEQNIKHHDTYWYLELEYAVHSVSSSHFFSLPLCSRSRKGTEQWEKGVHS